MKVLRFKYIWLFLLVSRDSYLSSYIVDDLYTMIEKVDKEYQSKLLEQKLENFEIKEEELRIDSDSDYDDDDIKAENQEDSCTSSLYINSSDENSESSQIYPKNLNMRTTKDEASFSSDRNRYKFLFLTGIGFVGLLVTFLFCKKQLKITKSETQSLR